MFELYKNPVGLHIRLFRSSACSSFSYLITFDYRYIYASLLTFESTFSGGLEPILHVHVPRYASLRFSKCTKPVSVI